MSVTDDHAIDWFTIYDYAYQARAGILSMRHVLMCACAGPFLGPVLVCQK